MTDGPVTWHYGLIARGWAGQISGGWPSHDARRDLRDIPSSITHHTSPRSQSAAAMSRVPTDRTSDFATLEAAKAFAGSHELKAAMHDAGLTSAPTIWSAARA